MAVRVVKSEGSAAMVTETLLRGAQQWFPPIINVLSGLRTCVATHLGKWLRSHALLEHRPEFHHRTFNPVEVVGSSSWCEWHCRGEARIRKRRVPLT